MIRLSMQILSSGMITLFRGTSISVPVALYLVRFKVISAEFLMARIDLRTASIFGMTLWKTAVWVRNPYPRP